MLCGTHHSNVDKYILRTRNIGPLDFTNPNCFWMTLKTLYDTLHTGEKITAAIRRNEMAPARCHTFCLSIRAAGEAAWPLDRIGHEPHPLSNFGLSITTLSVLRLITKVV